MAIHELYIGGPPTANYSRAMFPSAPFVAGSSAMQQLKVAAHKGPTSYGLTRVLDTQDHAVKDFLANNAVAQADVLGGVLIPKDVILKGFFYSVENAAGVALTLTPSLRGVAGGTLPAINGNVVGKGFVRVGGTTWVSTSAPIVDAAGPPVVNVGDEFFIAEPTILDLTLTAFTTLGDLKLIITPLVDTLYHGRM